ncbi:MMPL family transporter [Jannaschia sp. R86511]|uniref:MMPL family transporter n=1 Tax=Jannaschia sp. R86511 TaxID=3093853 RepID=UPI0036D3E9A0
MSVLARFAVARPWFVIVVWVLGILGAQVAALQVGSDYRNEFTLEGTDSQAALDVLESQFPDAAGDSDRIVWQVPDGALADDATAAQIRTLLSAVSEVETVGGVRGPLAPGSDQLPPAQLQTQISEDGTIAYATVQYDGIAAELPREDLQEVADLVAEADEAVGEDVSVAIGGQGVARLSAPEIGATEIVGIAFAAVVLFVAFGSLVAVSLPIASAIAALGLALGVIALVSNVWTVSDVAPVLGVLLGLGVGIDYALFIVNRFRGQLLSGSTVQDAVMRAMTTSGRAVVFAGVTVVIALAGVLVPGITFLNGLAIGAGIAVLATMLAAVTLLPALLGLLGARTLSRGARRKLAEGHRIDQHASAGFAAWARGVARRPVLAAAAGVLFLGVLAVPVADLRLGVADQGNDPDGTTTKVAYDLLADGFGPGFNGPLIVTADYSGATTTADGDGDASTQPPEGGPGSAPMPPSVAGLISDLQADESVQQVIGPLPAPDSPVVLLQVVPESSPQDEATSELIDRIRGPYAEEASTQGVEVHVGGATATFDDFAQEITDDLPLFFGLVIGASVLLLVIAFRSLMIPLLGAVMNLVSAAAAFGVIVAVFQWGYLADIVGVGEGGPIEPFIPIVLFALLFGLSMDYQVFLVSRIAEEWQARRDNRQAVRIGHGEVSKVILAAASIMVFVFGAFIFGDSRTIKLIGLGLAAAVLLDALVIRLTVVPALMHLLGRSNWWLPRWLDRILPQLSIEGTHQPEAEADATAPAPTAEIEAPGKHVAGATPDNGVNAPRGRSRWDDGYTEGYADAMQQRHDDGYKTGYETAARLDGDQRHRAGYEKGYQQALSDDATPPHSSPAATRAQDATIGKTGTT